MTSASPTNTASGWAGQKIRTVGTDELRSILAGHAGFLSRAPGGRRAILKFTDLSNLDLAGVHLAEADLSGAVLQRTNLANADLRDATLFGADLSHVNLNNSCLESADLRGVTLRDATLNRSNMTRIDLREGMLLAATGGHLEQARGDGGTTMHGATARGANPARQTVERLADAGRPA